MKSAFLLAFALVASEPGLAFAQQALDEELPPGLLPDDDSDPLFGPVDEGPPEPARIVLTAGGGSSIRIVQDLDFSQDRFAPAFIDLFGAFVLGGNDLWRHGFGLGLSTNLSGDGDQSQGVDGGNQLGIAPAYMAYFRLGWDLVVMGKAGLPMVVHVGGDTGGVVPGLEVGGSAAYFLTAGAGLYGELSVTTFLGGEAGDRSVTVHPIASAEIGVIFDYEVLP